MALTAAQRDERTREQKSALNTVSAEESGFNSKAREAIYRAYQQMMNEIEDSGFKYPNSLLAEENDTQKEAYRRSLDMATNFPDHPAILHRGALSQIDQYGHAMPAALEKKMADTAQYNPLQSDIYKDYMSNPNFNKVMQDYRDEGLRHLEEKVLPRLDYNFSRSGVYNSNAAKAARNSAAMRHNLDVEKDIRKMMHDMHREGATMAHQQLPYIQNAAQMQLTGRQQNIANLGSRQTLENQYEATQDTLNRSHQARELAAIEAAGKAGAAQQQQAQAGITNSYNQWKAERNAPMAAAAELIQHAKGIAPSGTSSTAHFTPPPVVPANPYGVATSALSQLAQIGYPHMQQKAKGGRIGRQKFAEGGAPQQPQMPPYSHEQQLLLQQIQRLQEDQESPMQRQLGLISSHALANVRGNPLENLGRALHEHGDNEIKRREHQTVRMKDAGDLMSKIQDSRQRQAEMLADMGYQKEHLAIQRDTLAETKRHHGAAESELGRHHLAVEREKQDKLTPADTKKENELNAKLDASISAYRRLKEMERLQPEINTGAVAHLPTYLHDILPESMGGTGGAQFEYEKEAEKYAQDRAKSIGGNRVTNFELKSAQKSTPTLTNSMAGIKRATDSEKTALQHTIKTLFAQKKTPYQGDIEDIEEDFRTQQTQNISEPSQSSNPYLDVPEKERLSEIETLKRELGM